MTEAYKEIVGRAEWEEVMKRHDESGLTGVQFCRQEGINLWTFKRWRGALRRCRKAGKFVQVKTPKKETPEVAGIEIEFPSGLILRIRG